MPSISMKPLVPSNPGPPKDPKSFWAPWPAISEPCTTRTIIGAASLTLEVFILTPSVAFSGHTTLVRQRRGRLTTLYTLDHPVYTPTLPLVLMCPSGVWPVTRPWSILQVYEATRFCTHRRSLEEDTQGGAAHSHRRLVGTGDDARDGPSQRGAWRSHKLTCPPPSLMR